LSDHDGVVAYLLAREVPFTAAGIVNSASFHAGTLAPSTVITIFGRQEFSPGSRVRFGNVRVEPILVSSIQIVVLTPPALPEGSVTVAVESEGTMLHAVEMASGPVTPALPLSLLAPDQTSFLFREGSTREVVVNGSSLAPVSARLCGVPAEVRRTAPVNNFLAVELVVPLACSPGKQRIEISVGSRTTQADLFTIIVP
jgi:hypothetical protein